MKFDKVELLNKDGELRVIYDNDSTYQIAIVDSLNNKFIFSIKELDWLLSALKKIDYNLKDY